MARKDEKIRGDYRYPAGFETTGRCKEAPAMRHRRKYLLFSIIRYRLTIERGRNLLRAVLFCIAILRFGTIWQEARGTGFRECHALQAVNESDHRGAVAVPEFSTIKMIPH